MRFTEHRDKKGQIDFYVGKKSHQVIRIYGVGSTHVYFTVSYHREEFYNSLSDQLSFGSKDEASSAALEWVESKSPVTLQRRRELEEENERVNRTREAIRREIEMRPKVQKEVPPEVVEKRNVRRMVKRTINRWIHSHDEALVHKVLREVVGELEEE